MIGLIIVGIIALIAIIVVQIGKVSELAAKIRGEAEVERRSNDQTARWLVIFMVVFLLYCIISAWYYKNIMLGYGPHQAASEHGSSLDSLFNWTLFFTGVVFVLTHIALFWFAYKYRRKEGNISEHFAHSNRLELIWTAVPAVVMVGLVTSGLVVWNEVMPDVGPDDEYLEIEATGYQFAWDLRYGGHDGKLGTKNFRLIDPGTNPLGQDWSDPKNIDDFHATELVLPVGQQIRVRITAKDVLHNFYLPHFRVKMDAIPGLPTYFIFTPKITTAEYRKELSKYPEYQVPSDPEDPTGPKRWETFDYELACAELCGKGHYSMQKWVRIVERDEYEQWFNSQKSYYALNIRNTDADPFKGKLLDYEIEARSKILTRDFEYAIVQDDPASEPITLSNLFFSTGSATLEDNSKYELDNLITILTDYPDVSVEIAGHTDNQGESSSNMILSQQRANAVVAYLTGNGLDASRLTSVGYGENQPADTNDTPEGRQKNRRIEMKIIAQNL